MNLVKMSFFVKIGATILNLWFGKPFRSTLPITNFLPLDPKVKLYYDN